MEIGCNDQDVLRWLTSFQAGAGLRCRYGVYEIKDKTGIQSKDMMRLWLNRNHNMGCGSNQKTAEYNHSKFIVKSNEQRRVFFCSTHNRKLNVAV